MTIGDQFHFVVIAIVSLTCSIGRCQQLCPPNSVYANEKCYSLLETDSDWYQAEILCQQRVSPLLDGHLAAIANAVENTAIMNELKLTADVWIGCYNYDGMWKWTDDEPFKFANFVYSPELSVVKTTAPRCGSISSQSQTKNVADIGKWNNENCDTRRQVLCQSKPIGSADSVRAKAAGCIDGWVNFAGNCYYYNSDGSKTSDAAESLCNGNFGWLTSIHSAFENNFVNALAANGQDNANYAGVWIGLREAQNNEYYWTDNSPLDYTNWMRGEPNNVDTKCVRTQPNRCTCDDGSMNSLYGWDDVFCDDTTRNLGFVCKALPVGLFTTSRTFHDQ